MNTTTVVLPTYDLESIYPNARVLSSSQVLCYETNPQDFYTEYVLGVRRPASVAMQIGSIFSALHHDRNYNARAALLQIGAPKRLCDLFEMMITRFPVVPAEIALKCKYRGWGFRATLDGFLHATIIENKTGKVAWTQERADESDQITFQSWVFWKKTKKVPGQIILNWVNTGTCSNPLSTFYTTRTVEQLQKFQERIDVIIENMNAENWSHALYEGEDV